MSLEVLERSALSAIPFSSDLQSSNIVPRGARICLSIGELDCRDDNFPKEVVKARYDTWEEAVNYLMHVYIEVLMEIKKRIQPAEVYVHPVPPTLSTSR